MVWGLSGKGKSNKDKSGNGQQARGSFNRGAEAQKVASKLPELKLEARRLASRVNGLRSRNKAGIGTEFHSFRPFENGVDEPGKIDHKASARMPRPDGKPVYLVREREMEVKKSYYLWCDFSGSMDYKSDEGGYTKKEVAEILAMASGYLATYAGDQFTLLGSNMRLRGDKKSVDSLMGEMALRETAGEDMPKMPLHRGKQLEKNSHVFIFTDALCPPAEILQAIKKLFHADVKGHIVQILDRQEIELDFSGRVRFTDMENEDVEVEKGQVEAVRKEYKEKFEINQAKIKDMIKRIPGWDFTTYVTDQPLHHALMPLYGIKAGKLPTPTPDAPKPK